MVYVLYPCMMINLCLKFNMIEYYAIKVPHRQSKQFHYFWNSQFLNCINQLNPTLGIAYVSCNINIELSFHSKLWNPSSYHSPNLGVDFIMWNNIEIRDGYAENIQLFIFFKPSIHGMMTSWAGNICRVSGPSRRPVMRNFDVFYLRLNKRLTKQSKCWWFETPSRSLWCNCNGARPCDTKVIALKYGTPYWTKILHIKILPC